jgi:hypothetical protein
MLSLQILRYIPLKTVSNVYGRNPYVTASLEGQRRMRTRPGQYQTNEARWVSGNTLKLGIPEFDLSVLVEVWDTDPSHLKEDKLVAMGEVNLQDYDADGVEEEPLEVELFWERKPTGRLSCLLSYDPPSIIQDGLQIGHLKHPATLTPLPTIKQRAIRILTELNNRAPTEKAMAVAAFGAVFLIPFVRRVLWWSILTGVAMGWTLFLGVGVPICIVLALPRMMGYAATKFAQVVTGGYPISIGTITFVPWISTWRRLNFRVIVGELFVGNPPNQGFSPKFLTLNRFEMAASIPFSDMWNIMRGLKTEPCPLRDVADFHRLMTVRMDHLAVDGATINMEVSDKNNLNIPIIIKEIDQGQVQMAEHLQSQRNRLREMLRKRSLRPDQSLIRKFAPNCLEVQVLGARNLKSMDRDGLSDPYYVVQVHKEERRSEPVLNSLNPSFPLGRVEQFPLYDASTVIQVRLLDADVARSEFLGQWVMAAKWLQINPERFGKYVEWDTLTTADQKDGWICFWAPLVNEDFRDEGMCGDVHVKLRWIHSPAFPDKSLVAGTFVEESPLEQLNELRKDIRMRLGDLEWLKEMLKHIPVLLDFHGDVILQNTKLSIHDLLFGKQEDNRAAKREDKEQQRMVEQKRYQREQQERQAIAPVPASDIRTEVTVTAPADAKVTQQPRVAGAGDKLQVTTNAPADVRTTQPQSGDQQVRVTTTAPAPTAVTPATLNTAANTAVVHPSLSTDYERVKEGESTTTTGLSNVTTLDEEGHHLRSRFRQKLHNMHMHMHLPRFMRKNSTSSDPGIASQDNYEGDQVQHGRVTQTTERNAEEPTTSGPTSSAVKPTERSVVSGVPKNVHLPTDAAAQNLTHMDEAVDPNNPPVAIQQISGAGTGKAQQEQHLERGETTRRPVVDQPRNQEETESQGDDYTDDYTLEEEEDMEYDQYGRKYAIIKPIIWQKQFQARGGDPGLNAFTFLKRLIRALIPKIATDARFEKALAGTAVKGVLTEKMAPSSGHGIKKVAHKVKSAVKDAALSAKEHAKLTEKKVASHVHPAGKSLDTLHYEPTGAPWLNAEEQRVLQARQQESLMASSQGASPSLIPEPAAASAQIPVVVTAANPAPTPVAQTATLETVRVQPGPTFAVPMVTPVETITPTSDIQSQPPLEYPHQQKTTPQMSDFETMGTGKITRTTWVSEVTADSALLPSTSGEMKLNTAEENKLKMASNETVSGTKPAVTTWTNVEHD